MLCSVGLGGGCQVVFEHQNARFEGGEAAWQWDVPWHGQEHGVKWMLESNGNKLRGGDESRMIGLRWAIPVLES